MLRLSGIVCLFAVVFSCGAADAGWPFFSEDGLRRGTPEYYEARASDPVGTRQRYYYGKQWPLSTRPCGPQQLCIHKYHAAHYWPKPYVCEDRAIVERFAEIQVANGWQTGTTLYDFHFDPVTHELNSSGQQHLHYILNSAPAQHRQTFVAAAKDPQFSDARVASVQRTMAGMVGSENAMPVALRVTDPLGRPAEEVNKIFTNSLEAMPPPTIIYKSASTD